jgi:hypothetical protein
MGDEGDYGWKNRFTAKVLLADNLCFRDQLVVQLVHQLPHLAS